MTTFSTTGGTIGFFKGFPKEDIEKNPRCPEKGQKCPKKCSPLRGDFTQVFYARYQNVHL